MNYTNKYRETLIKTILTAIFIAIAFLLPFLTMQIPQIGMMLSPMHIPVLLCGFICGWQYGIVCGFVSPLLRSLVLTMPPFLPVALAMAFEMAIYGALAWLLYVVFKRKLWAVYPALIISMIAGRIVWGGVTYLLLAAKGEAFTLTMFLTQSVINGIPGIILHIVLIPPIVMAAARFYNTAPAKKAVNENG